MAEPRARLGFGLKHAGATVSITCKQKGHGAYIRSGVGSHNLGPI